MTELWTLLEWVVAQVETQTELLWEQLICVIGLSVHYSGLPDGITLIGHELPILNLHHLSL